MRTFLTAAVVACFGSWAMSQQPATSERADTKKPATAQSIDGNWTVVVAEKNGQPMADAQNMTVTVKDNTITCSGKEGKPAMTFKIDFQGMGMARVTEQSGAAGAAGTSGTGNVTGAGTERSTTEQRSAGSADKSGSGTSKQAVYVLTSDMLAVCIHNDQAGGSGAGRGAGTGGQASGTGSTEQRGTTEQRGAGGAGGQSGASGQSGAGGASGQSGAITTGQSTQPSNQSYCTLILKRGSR